METETSRASQHAPDPAAHEEPPRAGSAVTPEQLQQLQQRLLSVAAGADPTAALGVADVILNGFLPYGGENSPFTYLAIRRFR